MATPLRCEWLLEDDTECGAVAAWTTDDLGEYHHLCDECHVDATCRNAYRVEALP